MLPDEVVAAAALARLPPRMFAEAIADAPITAVIDRTRRARERRDREGTP
jgi:hypothetical protein